MIATFWISVMVCWMIWRYQPVVRYVVLDNHNVMPYTTSMQLVSNQNNINTSRAFIQQ